MSELAGVLFRDGSTARESDIQGAVVLFASRGLAETRILCAGGAILACATHRAGAQPSLWFQDHEHGVTAVCDARLDTREELGRELDLPAHAVGEVSDGKLILEAWSRWGERCPEHLLGDFAFAIWDQRRGVLFVAHDQVGLHPLYWCESPRLFAFASRITTLTALPGVPRRLDPAQIADYLVGVVCEPAATFHAGVARLLPAHSLLVSGSSTECRRYFELTLPTETHRGAPREVAAGFRSVLDVAVRDRLRGDQQVGSMLSGGLDSSALVCLARAQLRERGAGALPTFSLVFPRTPSADERPFIAALVGQQGLEPHSIDADAITPLTDVEAILEAVDEPFPGGTFPYQWAIYRAAADRGVGALLDGNGGDAVVGHGYYFLADLLRRLRFIRLAREISGLSRTHRFRASQFLTRFALTPCVPGWARRLRRAVIGRQPGFPQPFLVGRELAERIRYTERFTAYWHRREPPRGDREHHLNTILDSMPVDGLDKAASAFGVDQRCPYFDVRVVQYCLRVPSEQAIEGGLTRMLTRRALGDLLPPLISGRADKAVPMTSLTRGLFGPDRELLTELIMSGEADRCSGYLDVAALRHMLQRHLTLPEGAAPGAAPAHPWAEVEAIRKAAVLLLWLRITGIAE
jgi:asparagine synthase (glutamine-hydrolysing)